MSQIPNLTNPNNAVIGSELNNDSIIEENGQFTVRFDPSSNIEVTKSVTSGIKLMAPAASTTLASVFDETTGVLTTTVNGVSVDTDLGFLDDEGVAIDIVNGTVRLKTRAGTVISSAPLPIDDNQILSIDFAPAGITVSLVDGGSVSFSCKEIYDLFADNDDIPDMSLRLLGDDCQKTTIKAIGEAIRVAFNLASGPITATVDPATGAVTIDAGGVASPPFTPIVLPGNIKPGPIAPGVTIPADQITGVIPAANLPPTTHTTVWDPIGLTLTDTVNGVVTVTDLGSLDDEGVTVGIVGGVLQLKNKAGDVIGSTPIPDSDGQILSIASTPTDITIALTNGGSVKFACADIAKMYPSGALAIATDEVLTKGCKSVKLADIVSQVSYGLLPPVVGPADKEGDQYFMTDSGAAAGQVMRAFIFDGTAWRDTAERVRYTPATPVGVGGTPLGGNIPAQTQVFTMRDGLEYASNLTLPPIPPTGGAFEPITIVSNATFDSSVNTTNRVPGSTPVIIRKNEPVTFYPSIDGWMVQAPPSVVTPGSIIPGAIGTGVTLPAGQITGVIPAANLPPVSCPQVIGCLVPGSVPANAVAAGSLGAGVTLPASQITGVISAGNLPPTTHTMTVTGVGPARALTSVVNGVSATVPVADLDQQALSIAGNVISLTNGGSVTIPASPAPATTHANTWTQAGGLSETVNGVPSNIAIPQGIPAAMLGYNAAGAPVWSTINPAIEVRESAVTTNNAVYDIPIPTAVPVNPFVTQLFAQTLIRAQNNATVNLPSIPAAMVADLIGVEYDIKAVGGIPQTITIAAPAGATIDGLPSISFTKTSTAQPSRSLRLSALNTWNLV